MLKVNPQVKNLIDPIARTMTEIKWAEKSMPVYSGEKNETPEVKTWKKRCVHFVYEGNELVLSLGRNDEGKLVCTACGREIAEEFDDTGWKKLLDALPVLNQMITFGMPNGLDAGPIQVIINIKEQLPELIKIHKELCEFVKRENINSDPASNFGAAYNNTTFKSVTSLR